MANRSLLLAIGLILFLIGMGLVLTFNPLLAVIGAFLVIYTIIGLRIIFQYEKGLLFTLGKYSGMMDAGLMWFLPIIQTMVKIDTRVQTIDLPKQEVITKDNVPVKINATVFFKVQYPDKAVLPPVLSALCFQDPWAK